MQGPPLVCTLLPTPICKVLVWRRAALCVRASICFCLTAPLPESFCEHLAGQSIERSLPVADVVSFSGRMICRRVARCSVGTAEGTVPSLILFQLYIQSALECRYKGSLGAFLKRAKHAKQMSENRGDHRGHIQRKKTNTKKPQKIFHSGAERQPDRNSVGL